MEKSSIKELKRMKMRKSILLAPDRDEKEIIPSCVNIHRINYELFKADFNFICEVCKYFDEHGNKEDKKWIENLVWNKLIPVYKNNNVDNELVEHLIAQVTDCVAFKVDDK
ncbi:MAG: hypothetical protein MJ184_07055 [Treponema sp.]|uniref:hypothetical protein n=1 Tax=Treponema sp. TaxID=166 RepID=UPI00298D624B|nr:hypothetical protein [Treponema sp.]MCQ2601104.1 hypothetical protein [Treponema sp.]